MSAELIQFLQEQRDGKQAELDKLLEVPTEEKRNLSEDEDKKFEEIRAELEALDQRMSDVKDLDEKRKAADEARKVNITVSEPNPVYRRSDPHGPSFFRDLLTASKPTNFGFEEARNRLVAAQETRAGDMTTVAGAGGKVFAAAAA